MNQALFDGELIYLAVPDPDKDAEVEARWTQDADYMHLLGSESAYPLTPGQIKQRYEESRKQGRNRALPCSWASVMPRTAGAAMVAKRCA